MKTNDIKAGMHIMVRGQVGIMKDNKRGNSRLVELPCINGGTEMGSVYAFDISHAWALGGKPEPVELTPKQVEDKAAVRAMGF